MKTKTHRSSHTGGIPRRQVLKAGAAGAALATAWPYVSRGASKEVVFATWGGSWEAAMRRAWFDPFTEKTGIKVRTVSGPSYGKIRAMVQAGNTQWDVVEVNPDFIWIGPRENLLEKINFNVVDVNADERMYNEYSVPQVVWSRVMVYNTNRFSEDNHPRNWEQVWDVERFPGKRAFYAKANGGTLELALMADGVPANREALYPLDVERAFKSLDRIADHILWYETNAQSVQMMMGEQAVVGSMADGRALSAIERGAPIAIEYNQSQLTWTDFVVPRGAPNRENAMRLLDYMCSAEAQAAIAMEYTYGPTNPKAYDFIPAERARKLSGGPQQQGKYVLNDEQWWGENQEQVAERFNTWRVT